MTWFWTLLVVLIAGVAALGIFVSRRDRGRARAVEPALRERPVTGPASKRDSGLDGGSI